MLHFLPLQKKELQQMILEFENVVNRHISANKTTFQSQSTQMQI